MKAGYRRRFLPSHAVLRSFECAARHQSFTIAAEELHLTQSAISRQVKELEHAVGTELFRRVGRRVVLTEAGQNLAAELALDLERIQQTLFRAIASGDRGGALRIAVLPTFASRWLVPRLPKFAQLHPETEVSLATRMRPFDLTREKFDLAIHFGRDDWPDSKMALLCNEEMVAVSSPQFKEKFNISSPGELANAPLLHLETRATAWADWFHECGVTSKKVYPGRHFDQFSMVIAGALVSLGAALLPKYLIEDELDDGRLLILDETILRTHNSYFIVTENGPTNPRVETFTKWIQSEVGTSLRLRDK